MVLNKEVLKLFNSEKIREERWVQLTFRIDQFLINGEEETVVIFVLQQSRCPSNQHKGGFLTRCPSHCFTFYSGQAYADSLLSHIFETEYYIDFVAVKGFDDSSFG